MPRISVPEGSDPLMHVWVGAAPGLSIPAAQFSAAVYEKSVLPLREFEAARIRIAQINECQLCLGWRSARDFAERFALDHLSMDDPFWDRMRASFTDTEIVDLGLCVGMWVSQGRLNQVLDVDGGCRVPIPGAPLTGG